MLLLLCHIIDETNKGGLIDQVLPAENPQSQATEN
jgi:hypothetical protein